MPPIITDHAVYVIVTVVMIGALVHFLSWAELEEMNWFDILMRGGPPFEDLSPRGQILLILSWICGALAAGLVFAIYVLPRMREALP